MSNSTSKYIAQKINELNHRFRIATKSMKNNTRGTRLYNLQVNYAYLVHDAETGPEYISRKHLQEAEKIVFGIEEENKQRRQSR